MNTSSSRDTDSHTIHEKLDMEKMFSFRGKSKCRRNDSRKPLLENNNNNDDTPVGNRDDNPSAQNTFNTHDEQHLQTEVDLITLPELRELLGVDPDASTPEDEPRCSVPPEPSSTSQNLPESYVRLIQKSVSQHFPKPPADPNKNLQQHLSNVQETLLENLVNLDPRLKNQSLIECLTDCYYRQTIDHLSDLLQNISSTQNSFVLIKWVLHTFLSRELIGYPVLKEADPLKNADLLLFAEVAEKAKDKVLENVQKEVREYLEKILQLERSPYVCDREEAYVQFYTDTIQCIEAMPKEAEKISSKLSDLVREVCFQELLSFLKRYCAEQTEILGGKAKMDKPETTDFIRSLKSCQELKLHVQTKGKDIKGSLFQETVETLENMEAFTLKLLMEIVANVAEKHLKNYFKTENKHFFLLIDAVKMHFPKVPCCQDVQKMVMDEAYKLITHIYFKHLIRSSQRNLKKFWSPDVGETVAQDANLLHYSISDLAPGVQQWNLVLLKIAEMLDCNGIDSVKIVVASMQKECLTWREDLELLPALLRWKGFSRWQVMEVLEAIPGYESSPTSAPWYCCLTHW